MFIHKERGKVERISTWNNKLNLKIAYVNVAITKTNKERAKDGMLDEKSNCHPDVNCQIQSSQKYSATA